MDIKELNEQLNKLLEEKKNRKIEVDPDTKFYKSEGNLTEEVNDEDWVSIGYNIETGEYIGEGEEVVASEPTFQELLDSIFEQVEDFNEEYFDGVEAELKLDKEALEEAKQLTLQGKESDYFGNVIIKWHDHIDEDDDMDEEG